MSDPSSVQLEMRVEELSAEIKRLGAAIKQLGAAQIKAAEFYEAQLLEKHAEVERLRVEVEDGHRHNNKLMVKNNLLARANEVRDE